MLLRQMLSINSREMDSGPWLPRLHGFWGNATHPHGTEKHRRKQQGDRDNVTSRKHTTVIFFFQLSFTPCRLPHLPKASGQESV